MKREWLLVGLLACASHEPPHTEVAIAPPPPPPPPSAKPAASEATDEELLAMIAPDAGMSLIGVFDEDGGGIGLGSVGTSTHGHLGPAKRVNGRIEPASVQRVVRANVTRTRACYEKALVKTPGLTGRVSTRFVVDAEGNVSSATSDSSSTVSDRDMVDCVVGVFKTLHFPKPEGGSSVTIVYPLIFTPGD